MLNSLGQINLRRIVFRAHTHARYKGQRSRGSKVSVETNGRTDGRTPPNSLLSSLTRSEKMALRYNIYLTVSGSAISGYLWCSTLNSSNCKHLPTILRPVADYNGGREACIHRRKHSRVLPFENYRLSPADQLCQRFYFLKIKKRSEN